MRFENKRRQILLLKIKNKIKYTLKLWLFSVGLHLRNHTVGRKTGCLVGAFYSETYRRPSKAKKIQEACVFERILQPTRDLRIVGDKNKLRDRHLWK